MNHEGTARKCKLRRKRMEDRTVTLIMPYDTTEQLKTVLFFLEPIPASHREEPGLFGEKKRAYITVQV